MRCYQHYLSLLRLGKRKKCDIGKWWPLQPDILRVLSRCVGTIYDLIVRFFLILTFILIFIVMLNGFSNFCLGFCLFLGLRLMGSLSVAGHMVRLIIAHNVDHRYPGTLLSEAMTSLNFDNKFVARSIMAHGKMPTILRVISVQNYMSSTFYRSSITM